VSTKETAGPYTTKAKSLRNQTSMFSSQSESDSNCDETSLSLSDSASIQTQKQQPTAPTKHQLGNIKNLMVESIVQKQKTMGRNHNQPMTIQESNYY
jgi:hypothetical protein